MKFLALGKPARSVIYDIIEVTTFQIFDEYKGTIVIKPGKSYLMVSSDIYYRSEANDNGVTLQVGILTSDFCKAVKNGNIVVRSFKV